MVEDRKENQEKVAPETGSDMIHEDIELEEEESAVKDKLKELKEKLKKCEKEKAANLDGWQRERADFLNYKRRVEEDRKREREQSAKQHVKELLPILDGFEFAMKEESESGNFRKGIEQIYSQFHSLLKSYGVEIIDPLGERFNPELHEGISELQVDEEKDHTVVSVIQKGYTVGEILIRPARVIVGVYKH